MSLYSSSQVSSEPSVSGRMEPGMVWMQDAKCRVVRFRFKYVIDIHSGLLGQVDS